MQKLFTFFAFFLLSIALVSAQTGPIVVQSGSQSWTYPDINTAVAQAPAGAYIYLPGGYVPRSNNTIIVNKPINIIGAGIHPDSTTATNYSDLSNCLIRLDSGCNNSSFEGFLISDMSDNNKPISNILISRIKFSGSLQFTVNGANNFLIYNCILSTIVCPYNIYNFTISNNIIMNYYSLTSNCYGIDLLNNIFLGSIMFTYYSSGLFNSNVKNNIFTSNGPSFTNSNLKNNCFPGASYTMNNSSGSGNYYSIAPQTVLPSYTLPFSFFNDYHVINGSVGDNGGDDGTDIGIYGGLYPWKEGNVPVNPHIRSATVSPQSNGQGNIHVNINVGAQDH